MTNLKLLLCGLFLLCFQSIQAQQRLRISPEMVYNISARGDAWLLFDDQSAPGPLPCPIPKTNNPWASFDATWNGQDFFFPIKVIVDLGSNQNITQICLRNAGDHADVVDIASGGPVNWNNILQHTANGVECHPLTFTNTRYLQFTFKSRNSKIREIELYGTQLNAISCPPAISSCRTINDCNCPRMPMEEFVGANSNLDIPAEKANAVGFVRAYQHTFFNEGYDIVDYPGYPNNEYTWSPTSSPRYDHDQHYQQLNDLGIGIAADVHKSPSYLTTFAYRNGNPNYTMANAIQDGSQSNPLAFIKVIERKPFDESIYPIAIDLELTDPAAYLEHADVLYQLTSRYGFPGNAANMKVASSNEAKHGLNLVQYIENWNEPDKWWHQYLVQNEPYLDQYVERRLGYFTPYEYAAMSSAGYDGHGETNGIENIVRDRYPGAIPNGARPVGIKNGNSNMKFAMCGLTEINLDYVRAVKFWFESNRPDIGFPFDAINFHHYSHNGNLGQQQQYGISPEEDDLKGRIRRAVDFRDTYLPGVEVWLSEFGYDTNANSIQSPDCQRYCGGDCNSPECFEIMREIQGQWVVRAFMEVAAAGADRAMVFTLRDDGPEANGTIYGSSGLNTWPGENEDLYESKTGWYYVSTLKNTTEGLQYDPTFVHNDPAVRLYRFVDDCNNPTKTVYAAWSPTSIFGNDTPLISNYQLPIPATNATLIKMQDDDIDGVRSSVNQCNGQLCIDVSERPVFIVIGEQEEDFNGCDCNYLNYNSSVAALSDEKALATNLYCAEGAAMNSKWSPTNGQEVILDLGSVSTIDHLFLYSDNATHGKVEIFTGQPGNWQFFSDWDVYSSRPYKWKTFGDLNRSARYIRLRAADSNINIGEVKVCGRSTTNGPTCTDGLQNGNETGIDCGGDCPPCTTCNDGIQNGNETGVDCGGSCPACPTCSDGIQNGDETGVDCGGSCPPCGGNSCQIQLRPNMFFLPNGQSAQAPNFAGSLADEQATMGDPINGQGSPVNTAWQDPWGNNQQAYVDLGQVYDLSSFHFFDGFGEGQFTVSLGKPSDGNAPFLSFNANAWPPQWVNFQGNNFNVQARYLTFTRVAPTAKINEIAICGSPATGGPTCTDGVQNGNETGVDCGGNCPPCNSCTDGIQNGNETGIDCGGNCPPCSTCTDGIQNGNETGVDCGGSCPPCHMNGCQISLSPSMFYDALGQPDAAANFAGSLADEQATMGDPINGQGTEVTIPWQFPWGNNLKSYVDLGQEYDISGIYCFDGYGAGRFQVSTGQPTDNNAPFIDFNANLWPPGWRSFDDPTHQVRARYLTFTRVDPSAKINEISICGSPATGGSSCTDGIRNGNETGVDCGGACPPCSTCNDGIQNGNETGIDCGGNCPPCTNGSCQIPLSPTMFFNVFGQQDAAANFGGSLADEQQSMGDPLNGQGNEVTIPWQFPWDNNVKTYIDLGQYYQISELAVFDGYGEGRFQIAIGQPNENQTPFLDFNANLWPPAWREFDVSNQSIQARYLTFTRVDPGTKINEISICGTPLATPPPAQLRTDLQWQKQQQCRLTLWPNPAHQEVHIYRTGTEAANIRIVDMQGRLLHSHQLDSHTDKVLDISKLEAGMYFIYLEQADGCPRDALRFVKIED